MPSTRDLDPRFRPWADWILRVGKSYDSRIVATSTRRSFAKQSRLYDAYRAGRSNLPAAPPGGSLHNYGLAVDIARIGISPVGDPLLAWLGRVWQYYGMRHGGARDPVHFEPPVRR